MPELQKLAKQIVEKWSRQLYDIKSEYDAEGRHDQLYRQYQQRLNKQKEKQALVNIDQDSGQDDEDPKSKKKRL